MSLSVVISTMGRPETLYRMLSCLNQQEIKIDEIILIEASGYEWKLEEFPIANINIQYRKGMSLSKARLLGLNISCAEYIAFLDDDVVIDCNYLKLAVRFLKMHEKCNGVGGIYVDKIIQKRTKLSLVLGKLFYIYGEGTNNLILKSGWADYVRGESLEQTTDAEWLFGCNGVYRKSALSKIIFEEEMIKWSFLEDVILGAKITKKFGVSLKILPSLKVIHDPNESSGSVNKQTIRMRVLYRHLFFRDIVLNKNRFKYAISILGNIALLIKADYSLDNITEVLKVYRYSFVNWSTLSWGSANEYILKKC